MTKAKRTWPIRADVIRRERTLRAKTQRQAAAEAGMSELTWLKAEAGKRVEVTTIRKIGEWIGGTYAKTPGALIIQEDGE